MNLQEEISKEGCTIVKFFSQTCGPCKMMSPMLKNLSETRGVKIIDIDVHGEDKDIASEHGVASVPTLEFYKDGELTSTHVGAMPMPQLLKRLV